jgi:hypothetical protein
MDKNNEIDKDDDELLKKNNNKLIRILLNSFIISSEHSIKKKYKFIKQTLDNIFIENDVKYFFMKNIQKIQKTYFALNKFAFHYKFKKSKIIVNEDLYLNLIDEKAKNSISIYQDNSIYKFILSDLVNIINNSLSNSSYFFSEPLPCKNPFNNIPFNKSTLYNIYFTVKKYNMVVSELFHFYFLSNFNLTKFKEDYETFLRDYVIKNYVYSKNYDILYSEVMGMLNTTIINYCKRIKIDIGLSCHAPQTKIWLDNQADLIVFGFEPVKDNFDKIMSSVVSQAVNQTRLTMLKQSKNITLDQEPSGVYKPNDAEEMNERLLNLFTGANGRKSNY